MQKAEQLIKDLIEEKYGNVNAFAAELGVSRSTLYRTLELGIKNSGNFSVVLEMFHRLGLDADAFAGGSIRKKDGNPQFINIPRYGSIAAGEPLEMVNSDDSHPIPSEMVQTHPNAFLLTVKGSSMDKIIPNGAYALIDPDAEVFDGDPVAVNINGFDATLKRYYKLTNGVLLKPDSNDPTHKEYLIDFSSPDAENVRVLGKLVWYTIPFDFKF